MGELSRVEHVSAVRGRGFLIGIDFDAPIAPAVVTTGRARGFILNATGPSTLRLAPALTLRRNEAADFTRALPSIISDAMASQEESA